MSHKNLFIAFVLLIVSVPATAAGNASSDITISAPFVRAVPTGVQNSAMFLSLQNAGKQDHALVSATSNISRVVELHTHTNVDGMMRMRKVEKIDLPAGQTTVLQPGGLHVMFIGLKNALAEGQQVSVNLAFEDGSTKSVTAPVKSISAMKGHHGMGKGHHGMGKGHHGMGKGHKKGGHGKMMAHANPMPNLMRIVKKQGQALNLSEKQARALADWRNNNHKRMHAMAGEVQKIEQAMYEASMSGASKQEIMRMADKAMKLRYEIISTKTDCRDNMRRILNKEQYAKVLSLYANQYKK